MTDKKDVPCRCPYCDQPLFKDLSECQPCAARVVYCRKCDRPLPHDANFCPYCGEPRPKDKGKPE